VKHTLAIAAAASLVLTLGCEEKKPTPSPTLPKAPSAPTVPAPTAPAGTGASLPSLPSDTTKAVTDMANDAKAKVVAGLQSSLDSVKSQLEAFVPKIQNAPMTQQPALASSLNDVQSKLAAATRQLADLKADYNASNWSKLADDAKASIASLQASVSELVAKVK